LRVLIDSSVWIPILRGTPPWTDERTVTFFLEADVLIADLIYVEVVRGTKSKDLAGLLMAKFDDFEHVAVSNVALARQAIANFMFLRSKGITVRGTVDLLIATWCIENNVPLLHADRDFAGFEEHLGLKRWVM
jgi:predicted nucleic acid-binding protein